MSNIISKPYIIMVESKSVAIIKDKSLKCFLGDTIDLIVKVLRDGESKYIDGSKVNIIYNSLSDGTSREQRFEDGGISISNNVINIRPKKNVFNVGNNTINIKVSNEEEEILLPPILFYISNTVDGELIERYEDDIQSLKTVEELVAKIPDIDKTITDMENRVNTSIDKLETEIDSKYTSFDNDITGKLISLNSDVYMKTYEINQKIDILSSDVNTNIRIIDTKVNNKIHEIDTVVLKSTMFTAIKDGLYVSFESGFLDVTLDDLPKYGLVIKASGCPNAPTVINSSMSFLTFTTEFEGSNRVGKAYFYTLIDKAIQGVTLSPTMEFKLGDGTTTQSLPLGAIGYKILIKTKIRSAYIDSAKCYSTPLGNGIF